MEAHQSNPPSQFNPTPWAVPWDHPPPPLPPPPNFEWVGGSGFAGDTFNHHHHHHNRRHDFHSDADFHGGSFNARKRKFDYSDGGNYAKLYVSEIPRTASEEEIRRLFEEHGNVVEVVLLHDKWTGLHQEYCFVKYASIEEAESAISALHNQFTFPGAMVPMKVKYADGEKKRLGLMQQHSSTFSGPARGGVAQHKLYVNGLNNEGVAQHKPYVNGVKNGVAEHKLYVNGLNNEASRQEIEEIFSSYGVITDVHIMRDHLKKSRGCGFVGFSQRCMAMAAINGLNGTYVMKGCDRPLTVRFAAPKKQKKLDVRPAPNSVDIRGNNHLNASHLGNLAASTQESTADVQAGFFAPVANKLQCAASSEMQQPPLQQPFSPSRFSQMSLQQSQTLESPEPCRKVESNSDVLPSECAPCALSGSELPEVPVDCDWSEHICPDGDKYYFNCVTCESRWEKPTEFALYEQQLQRQQLRNSSKEEPCSLVTLEAEHQRQSCDFERPQLAMPCSMEHTNEQVQAETGSLSGPSFVQ